MSKITLLFTDLEGTLVNTHTGNFEPQDMYAFLSKIQRLQDLTGTKVHIHLVSPMYLKQMKATIDMIDDSIDQYNSLHQTSTPLLSIRGGTVTAEESFESCYEVDKRIMPLAKDPALGAGKYGKEHYVRIWTDAFRQHGNLAGAIYCGNDGNDFLAMEYINRLPNGISICPKNSIENIQKIAKFVGEHDDLPGISEGFDKLIKELEKKKSDKENIDEVRE